MDIRPRSPLPAWPASSDEAEAEAAGARGASVARLLAWGAATALLVAFARTGLKLGESAELVRRSEPFQRALAAPQRRLLVVGDSTAVGTGASSPAGSVAGLLAQAYPDLEVENRGRDGAKFADVLRQLDGDEPFDMVLVQAGGNDVIRLRDLGASGADIGQVVRRARERAALVVVMPAGNVGNSPFFFPPLSWWMTRRSRELHTHVRTAARRHEAVYVNLFQEREDDPFVRHPELNAADGLHPSDAGYRLWFEQLQAQAALSRRLSATGP